MRRGSQHQLGEGLAWGSHKDRSRNLCRWKYQQQRWRNLCKDLGYHQWPMSFCKHQSNHCIDVHHPCLNKYIRNSTTPWKSGGGIILDPLWKLASGWEISYDRLIHSENNRKWFWHMWTIIATFKVDQNSSRCITAVNNFDTHGK